MNDDLQPSVSVGIKLASLAVHAAEATGPDSHEHDVAAIKGLMADPEVAAYLKQLDAMSLLPVRRSAA